MTSYMNSPESDIKNCENNFQDIIPDTLHTHLLKDHQIIRNTEFDSIPHWFSTNTFIRFMCAFQIGSLP